MIVNAFCIFVLYFLIAFFGHMRQKAKRTLFQLPHIFYDFYLYFLTIGFILDGKNPIIAFGSEIFMPGSHIPPREDAAETLTTSGRRFGSPRTPPAEPIRPRRDDRSRAPRNTRSARSAMRSGG